MLTTSRATYMNLELTLEIRSDQMKPEASLQKSANEECIYEVTIAISR